jgi:hypothetical protein
LRSETARQESACRRGLVNEGVPPHAIGSRIGTMKTRAAQERENYQFY